MYCENRVSHLATVLASGEGRNFCNPSEQQQVRHSLWRRCDQALPAQSLACITNTGSAKIKG
jgi:hypothetical protein